MITYWYHEGKVDELEFTSLLHLTSFNSPIPINAQLYIPEQVAKWNQDIPTNRWYQVNARNRLVPVPIGVCGELRAALLIMGIPIKG